jgi:hypothetical protein
MSIAGSGEPGRPAGEDLIPPPGMRVGDDGFMVPSSFIPRGLLQPPRTARRGDARVAQFSAAAERVRRAVAASPAAQFARGGVVGPAAVRDALMPARLAPGHIITTPEEAEAMGLTADAARMRRTEREQ